MLTLVLQLLKIGYQSGADAKVHTIERRIPHVSPINLTLFNALINKLTESVLPEAEDSHLDENKGRNCYVANDFKLQATTTPTLQSLLDRCENLVDKYQTNRSTVYCLGLTHNDVEITVLLWGDQLSQNSQAKYRGITSTAYGTDITVLIHRAKLANKRSKRLSSHAIHESQLTAEIMMKPPLAVVISTATYGIHLCLHTAKLQHN